MKPAIRRLIEDLRGARVLVVHPRDADGVLRRFTNHFTLGYFSGDAVDGFVGVIFGERTAPPFKQSDQMTAQFQIFLPRALTVGVERSQQLVERILR